MFGKSAAAFLLVKMLVTQAHRADHLTRRRRSASSPLFWRASASRAGHDVGTRRNLVLAGAILSIMLNPLLFTCWSAIWPKTETIEEQISRRGSGRREADPGGHVQPRAGGRLRPRRQLLGGKLAEAGIPLVVIENFPARGWKRCANGGIKTVLGNAANPEVMDWRGSTARAGCC